MPVSAKTMASAASKPTCFSVSACTGEPLRNQILRLSLWVSTSRMPDLLPISRICITAKGGISARSPVMASRLGTRIAQQADSIRRTLADHQHVLDPCAIVGHALFTPPEFDRDFGRFGGRALAPDERANGRQLAERSAGFEVAGARPNRENTANRRHGSQSQPRTRDHRKRPK